MFKDWDDYFQNSTPLPDDFEAATPEMRKVSFHFVLARIIESWIPASHQFS